MNALTTLSDTLLVEYCQTNNIAIIFSSLRYPSRGVYLSNGVENQIMLSNRIRDDYTLYRSTIAMCLGFHMLNKDHNFVNEPLFFTVYDENCEKSIISSRSSKVHNSLCEAASFFLTPLFPANYASLVERPVKEVARLLFLTDDLAMQVVRQLGKQANAISVIHK